MFNFANLESAGPISRVLCTSTSAIIRHKQLTAETRSRFRTRHASIKTTPSTRYPAPAYYDKPDVVRAFRLYSLRAVQEIPDLDKVSLSLVLVLRKLLSLIDNFFIPHTSANCTEVAASALSDQTMGHGHEKPE